MPSRHPSERRSPGVQERAAATSGMLVGLAGGGFVAAGLWARREAERALARERIVSTSDAGPPRTPGRSVGAAMIALGAALVAAGAGAAAAGAPTAR